jgi:anaerobic dimethyl sulfoxide reductase subunit C (anchor subunit)
MNSKEWPLIIFTLSMQFSAGIILIYNLFLLSPLCRNRIDIPARFQLILLIALAAAILGVTFSFLHLGNPLNATRTVANIGTSWLSREILSVLIFTGLLVVVTYLHFRYPSAGQLLKWLVDITAVAGLILIFTMSRIYMIPARPAWNTLFTPIGFYLAALVMGSALLLIFQINTGSWASQKALAILTVSVAIIQLILVPVYVTWLSGLTSISGLGMDNLLGEHQVAFYIRIVLYILAIGFGLWALLSIRSDTLQNRYLYLPAFLTLCSVLVAQITDRYLFYVLNFSAEGF